MSLANELKCEDRCPVGFLNFYLSSFSVIHPGDYELELLSRLCKRLSTTKILTKAFRTGFTPEERPVLPADSPHFSENVVVKKVKLTLNLQSRLHNSFRSGQDPVYWGQTPLPPLCPNLHRNKQQGQVKSRHIF